jgi:uncharacterized protein YbbC (DUF1343 family)
MTGHRNLKKIIRARQQRTGEAYTAARAHVMRQRAELLGSPAEEGPSISATTRPVRTGLQRVLDGDVAALRGKRLGLLVNQTAVDGNLCHAVDRMHATPGISLVALFGPEHGIRGDAQDMAGVDDDRDAATGLPIHSLYGATEESIEPRQDMLAGLDALVFDIQDIGSRYYTYVWTLFHAMRACARAGVEVIVLDRPNPLGGVAVEGGGIRDGYRSFVGRCSLPNRHGMTVGEIATMVNETERIGCELHVVSMEGWARHQTWPATGLPWVSPSPNMPTLETAFVYSGTCLVEGTELSEGRGTTRPFETVGAGFITHPGAQALAAHLGRLDLPGVRFRPLVFTPTFHKFAGVKCGGVQLEVRSQRELRPYLTGVAILRAIRELWPDDFRWCTREYEFVKDTPAIDLLCGGPDVRQGIDAGLSLEEIARSWSADEKDFVIRRRRWLLYPED